MAKQTYLLGKAAGMDEGQLAYAARANRDIYRILKETADDDALHTSLEQLLQQHALANNVPAEQAEPLDANQLQQLMSAWYRYFIQYDPEPSLSAITVPVLAINGDKDLQVTAQENLEGIRKALEKAGNPAVTIRNFPRLNHLFQESQTGAISEYATIEQTISPAVLQLLSDWITAQTAR